MTLLAQMEEQDHEQVLALQNRACGLRGFLAIHDTTRGPALGGVRIWRYGSEAEALADALRLSRAMSLKASLAGLPCGGGKAVLIDHPGLKRSEAFAAFGRVVESLGGRFYTGRDVGITAEDLAAIGRQTRNVACESSPQVGNLDEQTALGVWHALRACLEESGIGKARVAIQGLGGVGMQLARILNAEGMELVAADIEPELAAQARRDLGAEIVPPEEILSVPCDVLAPCALGGIVNSRTLKALKARIICGSANNVLATHADGDALASRGILYAPDYLANAGALIRGAEFYLLGRRDSDASLARIGDRMREVIQLARRRGISTARAADELALAGLKAGKGFVDLWWPARPGAAKTCEGGGPGL